MERSDLSLRKRGQRRLVKALVHTILPAQIRVDRGGLQRATHLAASGYGLLVLMNHFSLRDGLQVLDLVYGKRLLRRRPTLAPAAAYHLTGSFLPALGRAVGVRLLPVTPPESVARYGVDPDAGLSPLAYAREAVEMLGTGGIVLLAPQAGRRPALGEPRMRPVSLLLAQARRHHVRRVVLLFVGLGVDGAEDYALENVGGFNLGCCYEIRIGRAFTLEEALTAAGSLRGLDDWSYEQLRSLVPACYAAPPGRVRPNGRQRAA